MYACIARTTSHAVPQREGPWGQRTVQAVKCAFVCSAVCNRVRGAEEQGRRFVLGVGREFHLPGHAGGQQVDACGDGARERPEEYVQPLLFSAYLLNLA